MLVMIQIIVKNITGTAPLMYSGQSKNTAKNLLLPSYCPTPMKSHNNMEIPKPTVKKIGVGAIIIAIQYLTLATPLSFRVKR